MMFRGHHLADRELCPGIPRRCVDDLWHVPDALFMELEITKPSPRRSLLAPVFVELLRPRVSSLARL